MHTGDDLHAACIGCHEHPPACMFQHVSRAIKSCYILQVRGIKSGNYAVLQASFPVNSRCAALWVLLSPLSPGVVYVHPSQLLSSCIAQPQSWDLCVCVDLPPATLVLAFRFSLCCVSWDPWNNASIRAADGPHSGAGLELGSGAAPAPDGSGKGAGGFVWCTRPCRLQCMWQMVSFSV